MGFPMLTMKPQGTAIGNHTTTKVRHSCYLAKWNILRARTAMKSQFWKGSQPLTWQCYSCCFCYENRLQYFKKWINAGLCTRKKTLLCCFFDIISKLSPERSKNIRGTCLRLNINKNRYGVHWRQSVWQAHTRLLQIFQRNPWRCQTRVITSTFPENIEILT